MSKNIQVNLAFNADTTKAKQSINELVNSLNKISTKDSQIFDDKNLREAQSAAKDLTKHLEAAVNVNTGKLDFNKFTQSLTKSNQSLDSLYSNLIKAGPDGERAFAQLASSIASSDSKVLSLNSKIKDLGTTLANTVKWQLSSSLIHGFMGALQHAFNYAKDLNSSLNDIRIVTGASVDEMARFAEQANKSARALSATTTEYTKASLIYYQQGLNADEVKERTDVTIKMANVSKESAQVVADQMTAVWNNFDDGTKSLEYYADVMTALGATTASSVDEIAGGLEKFAAIGDTIGLSYEYAASALATITSNTRQSEEVVGTALKTIFARIQGLNLGETLDDGTTLNKYSEALQKVGISIFDQAGGLKSMDDILDEMGNKWQTLQKDQQIALAQTVAGTRQYTQLVALMDNWNDGSTDSFQANLTTAYNSEGALNEQQEIYAESWEAAADRVTAAAEDIYDSLINDEFIIDLLNGLEKVLNLVGTLIDGFGGLKGIFLVIGGIFAKQFAKEVPETIEKLKNGFGILTGKGQEKKVSELEKISKLRKNTADGIKGESSGKIRADADAEEFEALAKLEKKRALMTESQYESAKAKIAETRASKELIASIKEEAEENEKAYKKAKQKARTKDGNISLGEKREKLKKYVEDKEEGKQSNQEKFNNLKKKKKSKLTSEDEEFLKEFEQKKAQLDQLNEEYDLLEDKSNANKTTINDLVSKKMDKLREYQEQLTRVAQVEEDFNKQMDSYRGYAKSFNDLGGQDSDEAKQIIDKMTTSMKNYLDTLKEVKGISIDKDVGKQLDEIAEKVKKGEMSVDKFIKAFEGLDGVELKTEEGTFKGLSNVVEKASKKVEEFNAEVKEARNSLESLKPDSFNEIANAAEIAGEKTGEVAYKNSKAKNQKDMDDIDNQPDINLDGPEAQFSSSLSRVGGLMFDIAAIGTTLGGAIATCFNDGATAAQKFGAVLATLPALAMSLGDILGTIKDWPEISESLGKGFAKMKEFNLLSSDFAKNLTTGVGGALTGLSTKLGPLGGGLGKLGGAITGTGAAAGGAAVTAGQLALALGAIALAAVAVIGIGIGLVKLFQKIKAESPEGKLEAAKNATEGMAEVAKDADQEYSNLLNTISSYDSALEGLEALDKETQEFSDAITQANEKAWELINTLGLIYGEDWDYGKNGEIIINKDSIEEKKREQSEVREKAIVATSSTKIDEAKEDYNVAAKNANIANVNDPKQVFDAFGFGEKGFSKILKDRIDTINNDKTMTEQERMTARSKLIDEIGNNYYGDGNYNSSDLEQRSFIYSLMNNFENLEKAYGAYSKVETVEKNEKQKMISSVMSNEEAYQKSEFKGLINDTLSALYDKSIEDKKTEYAEKSEEDVQKEFSNYLKDAGYTEVDGKVYNSKGDEVSDLSGLTADGQRNILATNAIMEELETKGLETAESVNGIAKTMSKEEASLISAMSSKNVNALTESQIKDLQQRQKSGELSLNQLFDPDTLEAMKADETFNGVLDKWFSDFEKQIENWEPPEFNLDEWKQSYSEQMKIIEGLEFGEEISPEDYDLLGDAAKTYFDESLNGNYRLIGSAKELKEIIESTEIDKLKTDIKDKKEQINRAGGALTEEEANKYRDGYANQTFVEAMGLTWDEDSMTNQIESSKAAMEIYDQLYGSLIEDSQAMALTANNLEELDALFKDGYLSVEDYNKRAKELKNVLDEDIDVEQYENLTELIQKMAESSDENNEGALEFNQNLKDNKKAAQDVAKAILRYDSSVEKVKKNSKEWMKILKSGNLQDMADIMDDLKNNYNDMLDLEGDALSEDFITNTENLELMTEAANGSEEAYNELAKRAAEDIIANCKLKTEDFDAKYAEFQNSLASLNLPDLEVGANLDTGNFLQACTDLINAAGMTATEAANYLGSMGIDAEIESEDVPSTEIVGTELQAQPYSIPYNYYVPSAWGTPMVQQATFPGVRYATKAVEGEKKTVATALKVTSATKSSGGGIKHANSSNGSGSKSGSSGGGGGGGGQKKYAEKKNDSDKSRYHTLQNQLEDLSSEYDAISDAADRAFGKEKLDNIDAQIDKTQELINKQEEYLKEISKDLPIDKNIMTAYYDDVIGGIAMEFDEKGNISNYDAIQDAMYAKYNSMAETYTDDSLEWQEFEKKYEQLEKYIEQYEETYDLLRDEEAAYQELLNQRAELALEKVQYKIELELAVPEDEIAVIEYQLGRIEDDAFKSAESIGLLTDQAEAIYDQIQVNKKGMEDVIKIAQQYNDGMLTEDQADAIKDYRDNLLDLNEQLDGVRENIESKLMEAFDAWNEKLDEGLSNLEHYNSVLESYKNIIDIVGKDTLGLSDQFIADLNQQTVEGAIRNVGATRDAYEALLGAQRKAEQALKEAEARGDEASIKMWSENLSTITEEAQAAQEEMLSAWEEALNSIAEQFEATVERVVKTFNDSVYALGGLEGLQDDFSRQKENADIMLDDYQKIYELSKLSRDINKTIDDTESLAGKQKLKKLLGEINKLQEDGVEMSQYDLEYLQKTYDLRLAEMELEEAQRAKNTVRLSKDNEGNWSYIYTQNTDAVDAAQQKYEDALYAMQDLSSNYIDEMSEQLISTSQEMAEALAAIRIQDFASIDEYYAEVERVQKQYQDELAMQQNELQKAIDNNKTLYDTDWTNYHNATGYKISDTQNFATTFKDTLLGALIGSEEDTANFANIIGGAVDTLTTNLMIGAEQYYANLNSAMNEAGTSTNNFAEDTAKNIDEVVEKSKEGAAAVDQMAVEMQEAFSGLTDTITAWQESYGAAIQNIINSNLAVIESFNEMLKELSIDADSITVKYDIADAAGGRAQQFDTGGYTGEWGASGKLAVLHQKELILNENDTSNFLTAIRITRAMLETIDLNAKQASLGYGGLMAASIKDEPVQTLEQEVHIVAEFPNVSDHNEIEMALGNLINTASQYANRK